MTIGLTIFVLLLACLCVYVLVIWLVEKWCDVLFFFFLMRMLLIVGVIVLIYVIVCDIGMFDNIWMLVIFYTVMNFLIVVWMLCSFMSEVLGEVLEVGCVDGVNLR